MIPALTLICTLVLGGAPALETNFQKLAPATVPGKWERTPGQFQAVVLIHGLHYHWQNKSVPKAEFRPWQYPDSTLVKILAKHVDVYGFAYGQNVCLDTIVKEGKLGNNIALLREMGYRDVVLVGHSAGGLIARQFVEDFPDAGVTKVIQVCSPNGGSPLANIQGAKSQKVFMECLTHKGREQCLKERADKCIPEQVQFFCVVARMNGASGTDGVVPCIDQWTADLQKQGIGAIGVLGSHREVVRDAKIAEVLVGLIRERQERWTEERIDKARKTIFVK